MPYGLFMIQLILVLIALFLVWQSISFFRSMWRYKKAKATPFPQRFENILQTYPQYQVLPAAYKTKLHLLIMLFLQEKEFIGEKIEITEEIKLIVAFYACLMRLGFAVGENDHSRTIIIYPYHFIVDHTDINAGIYHQKPMLLEGQSANGTVVISWQDIESRGNKDNVIIHEFAHELDFEDGFADGVPVIESANYSSWAKVFSEVFFALRQGIKEKKPLGKYLLLGTYAATNEAEFFAVCSERFFQTPTALQKDFPSLYEELKTFYKLDTAVLFQDL